METGKIVFGGIGRDGMKKPFYDHLKKDGFIIHMERSRELIVTLAKRDAIELSQAIEKLQREGNFSPFLRDLNRKLIQYLKAVKHYVD